MTEFLVLYFLFAVAFSRLEKFIYGDCGLHVGAPDFYVFKKAYHIPMAVVFLIPPVLEGAWALLWIIPALWIEDMCYYINNEFDKPDESESITDAWGFFLGIPVVWIAGFVYTGVLIWFSL